MNDSSPSACSLCRTEQLDKLIRTEPQLARQWAGLPHRRLAAGETLLRQGATVGHAWLIEKGVLRCYFLSEDGVERNKSFHAEGEWVGVCFPGIQSPSPYTIAALEAAELVELPQAIMARWLDEFPVARAYIDEALNYLMHEQTLREAELLLRSPEQRYQSFLAEQGAIAERIPLHHAASYLGVTNVTLSRIRARLGLIERS
ncbi:MAG TPA: Crp/Fnr family transcriptional regulator [Rhodocyclaceae bacterium]|nr:Crp/Fnr family transcriptional regulator [Rhodocyclaceae bacterium]